jgi:hypothetical protein
MTAFPIPAEPLILKGSVPMNTDTGVVGSPPEALLERLVQLGIPVSDVRLDDWALALGHVARAFAPTLVVEVALTERGRQDLDWELQGRRWADGCGLRTPPVVDSGPGWVVSRRWPDGEAAGPDFVRAAIEAADLIAAHDAPTWATARPPLWRATSRGRLRRAARLAAGGMRLVEFARARRIGAHLPADSTAHGDFHPGNLLFDPERCELAVVDWTHLDAAPRHTDLVRLWGQLPDDADSAAVAEAVLARTSRRERASVGALWHWLALRQLAEHLVDPAASDNPDQLGLVRRRLDEARGIARELGSDTLG